MKPRKYKGKHSLDDRTTVDRLAQHGRKFGVSAEAAQKHAEETVRNQDNRLIHQSIDNVEKKGPNRNKRQFTRERIEVRGE